MFWKTPTVTIRGHKFDAYQLDAYWKGMEDEQDRIIKLLQDYEWTEIFIPTLIELIKGEDDE